jgi:hypothetical protein
VLPEEGYRRQPKQVGVVSLYIRISAINLITQGDSGRRVNILEGDSVSHCEKRSSHEHVSKSE